MDYNFRTSAGRSPLRPAEGEQADDHLISFTPENAVGQKTSSPYKQKTKGGAPYT